MKGLFCRPFARTLFITSLFVAGSICEMRASGPDKGQDRIEQITNAKVMPLPGTLSPRASRWKDIGTANASQILPSITLRFNMTGRQKSALARLLIDQQTPSSSQYHHWLSPEQLAAQFGLSAGDMAAVANWLTSQGFTVTSTGRSRTFIQFSGSVAQAQTAFHTSIHRVSLDGEEHVANITATSLPATLASVVQSLSGLDDFKLKPRAKAHVEPGAAGGKYTSSVTGSTFIAPGDFYTIYDEKPLLNSSINGTGVTIAVAGQTDIDLSDVAAFRSAAGLSANLPTVRLYGPDPGTPTTKGVAEDLIEADLDVEWSGAAAPGASILYVNSTDVINSLTQIIDNNLAPIASISYGDCEAGAGAREINSLNQLFMQANAEGITVVSASGDAGATDCDYQVTSATQGLAVDFPSSSPYVTGIGGTTFNENGGTYFATTNDSNGGSALSYIPEAVWNETAAGIATGSARLSAGGGGLSSFFAKPLWQTGPGVVSDFARDVPDVSLNAAAGHDGYLFCSQGSCVNGFRGSSTPTASCKTGGCFDVIGGTSAGAPGFAGILALVEQKIGSNGVGNANPVIYALANSTYAGSVFHDVTAGNNASPCTAGSTDCPTGGSIGYNAGVGYDLATGWGSVDVFSLASDWLLVSPTNIGATGTVVSTTTLSASATSVTAGTTVTLTATVASGDSTPGTTPTGSVQFLIDNTAQGGAVTISGGVATYSLLTGSLTSGNHVVSAAYSGDTIYAASKSSVNLDVTSSTNLDFLLTPSTATATVKAGLDAPGIVFTVAPVNGYTGSVGFTASTTSSTLAANYSFSVSPVTINSGTTSATTILVLSAYVANARTGTGQHSVPLGGSASATPRHGAGTRPGCFGASGAAVACLLLLVVPRRRRYTALLGVALSVAALGGAAMLGGCGSGTRISPIATSQTNSIPGTYTIDVSATGTDSAGKQLTHNSVVTFIVQ